MRIALLALVVLVSVGCGSEVDGVALEQVAYIHAAPAQPVYRVVPADEDTAATLGLGAALWNEALGYDALIVAELGEPCGEPGDVCVRVDAAAFVPEPGKVTAAGWLTCGNDECDVYALYIRPDSTAFPSFMAHELGHVLGGNDHSTDSRDLMFRTVHAKQVPVVSAWAVDNVRTYVARYF